VPEELILPHEAQIHFINKFKYLWCIITPLLNEDAEIDARIKKDQSIMGASKHFFDNNGVDCRVKMQIYIAVPLNALLWGCESWNLTRRNLNKLRSFHHGAIRRILQNIWSQVREDHIKNLEVRRRLFINRRTAKYVGKISRLSDFSLPKKFLAAWINEKRKSGAP
jgi:hypothetical protein